MCRVQLCELLEHFEKRTFKKPHDFELMDHVLRCLRSLMNLEQGMNAMLGLADLNQPRSSTADGSIRESAVGGEPSARPSAEAGAPGEEHAIDSRVKERRRRKPGLRQLALCADSKHEALEARHVQSTALTLLSAAALFSEDGHSQVQSPPSPAFARLR